MTNAEKALKMHEEWQGKLETLSKAEVKSKEDLAIAYTPGVAEPCKLIAEDKELAYSSWTAISAPSSNSFSVGDFSFLKACF